MRFPNLPYVFAIGYNCSKKNALRSVAYCVMHPILIPIKGISRVGLICIIHILKIECQSQNNFLEIAHINDHHSHLDPELIELNLDGVRTRMRFGSLPALAGIFNSLPASVLKIHAGDALTGTLYYTLFKGQADAALMNTICFDIFVLGNHEFDDGDGVLQRFLEYLRAGPCNTTVLSANVIPQVGTPLATRTPQDYFVPWTSKNVNGMAVAVVGITVRNKTMLSSRPLPTTRFLDEQTAAQKAIDEAIAEGFKYVVLVTHQGYATDVRMAQRLRGVDVIIGGDSHSLLGNWSRAGMRTEGPYPTVVQNADGKMVCVGQAWEFSKAFGRMRIEFDSAGDVSSCTGNVILPVAQNSNPMASTASAPTITKYTLQVGAKYNTPYEGSNSLSKEDFAEGISPGYGSGLEFIGMSGGSYQFYGITDRGPTGDAPTRALGTGLAEFGSRAGRLQSTSTAFASPGFVPSVGLITVSSDAAILESAMPIKASSGGQNASGLPPLPGVGAADVLASAFRYAVGGAVGELPLDDEFAFVGFDTNGLDTEAVAYDAGSRVLWVSDEYAPSLVKIDAASGLILKKYRPGTGAKDLPRVLSHRRPNRGFEGLCLDKDTGRLHGILQSPIDPRDGSGRSLQVGNRKVRDSARFVRWLEFDPATEASKLYALPIEGGLFLDGLTGEAKIGDVVSLGGGKFIVILQGAEWGEADEVLHWLCLVQIPSDVTDIVAMDENLEISSMTGAPSNGVSYAGVIGLRMLKLLDLDDAGWEATKAEGLALVDERTLAVINDNDFGVETVMTYDNGTAVPDKSVKDCVVIAASGQFVECLDSDGYSTPPARMRKASAEAATTSLWLVRFAEPLTSLFPESARFDHYNALSKSWSQVSDAEAKSIESILSQDSQDSLSAKVIEVDENAARVLKHYSMPMVELRKAVIGVAGETLCFGRVPGRGNVNPNSPECVAATREQGSAMTQVVAEALLNASKRAVISIQNAGGVRQGIVAGEITIDTAYLVLPFSNFLYELEMTGQEILDTLEEAGEFAISTSSGSHPYSAGMRWCFNRSLSKGQRFANVEVRDKQAGPGSGDNHWQPLDISRKYVVVANDYIASGQDGYATLRLVQLSGRGVNTYIDYTQVLINYVEMVGRVLSPPLSDFSHKAESKCATGILPRDNPNPTRTVLDIAHINDHHSHLDPELIELNLDGVRTRMRFGSLPALAGIFNSLPASVLKIHAGDALTGTLYYTLFKGQADAALMNTICFDIFVLGNHEFDDGDGVLQRFLEYLRAGPCNTTVLSANVIPQVGTPLATRTPQDYFVPWTSKNVNGMAVAVVGITVRNKTMLSSRPLPTTRFLDEQTAAQKAIDEAIAEGFKYVVLVTHQGYATDVRMAQRLRGVDVIIGGDSHSLLGNWSRAGMRTEGPYPTVVQNADGKMVCVGQAWEFSKAFGRMRIEFDSAGDVSSCTGNVILPVAQNSNPMASTASAPTITKYTLQVGAKYNTPYEGSNSLSKEDFAEGISPGYGSGLEFIGMSGGSYQFYGITDRGPTGDAPTRALGTGLAEFGSRAGRLQSTSTAFASPGFVPSVGLITVSSDAAILESAMPIKASSGGQNASGLPPLPGVGAADVLASAFRYAVGGAVGELPLDDEFAFVGFDTNGLDTEAVAYDAGSRVLWVSDEYAPSLVKIDAASGLILKKYRPGTGAKDLPRVLSHRRPNRGFEGLCLDKDTGRLHGILQSPIDPRDGSGRSLQVGNRKVRDSARFVRWLEFDPATEASKLYALPIEGGLFLDGLTGEAKIGDVVSLGGGKFIVILQGAEWGEADEVLHWLCLVQIPSDVTDIVAMDENLEISSMTGAPSNGVSYAGVIGLRMLKLLDLDDAGWEATKAEGLALVDERTLAVINDNDFGVETVMTYDNGTAVPDKSVKDCVVIAASGQFVECLDSDGYSTPPARMRKASAEAATTSLWLVRFAEPLTSLFPESARFDHYNALSKSWSQVSDAEAKSIESILSQDSQDSLSAKVIEVDENAARVLKHYSMPMVELRKAVIGVAGETLCFGRVPGRGNVNPNSPECVAATREQGSAMTQVVAEALLNASKRAVISIQNAGGVRQGIVAGEITIDTAYLVLPFSNFLYELEMTGQEILDTLEEAGEFAISTSSGSHPYSAGMRWCFNRSLSKGQRFANVEVRDKQAGPGSGDNHWQPLDISRKYVVVANDYIASGQDGYATLRLVQLSGRGVNTYIDYTQVLINYVEMVGRVLSPPLSDFSHKSFKACSVLDFSSVNETGHFLGTSPYGMQSVSFLSIKAIVGNLSQSIALAMSVFSAVRISAEQFSELVAAANSASLSGNKGRPYVVFAAPGIILQTLPSEVYKANASLALETKLPTKNQVDTSAVVSSIVKFTNVSRQSPVFQLSMYPLRDSSKLAGTPECTFDVERRLTKRGAPQAFACNCPPTLLCESQVICTIRPNSGDEWFVVQLPTKLCKTIQDSSASDLGIGWIAGVLLFVFGCVYVYRSFPRKSQNSASRSWLPLSESTD